MLSIFKNYSLQFICYDYVMKHLSDYKEEITRCSKCGLCQSVCPVYNETGNDCAVSRGKFVMLDGVLKGDLKLNKNIIKYIDMCLKCGKCEDFCPSGIKVCKIFETAKYQYLKNKFFGKFIFFLESEFVFNNIIKFLSVLKNQKKIRYKGKLKLLYFKGCYGNIFPKTEILLNKLATKLNIEIIEKDFECCGIPFLSSGNLKRFEDAKVKNLNFLNCNFDYIFTDCASCESTLINYYQIDKSKLLNLGELIVKQNIKFKSEKNIKVTFHKPCHLKDAVFFKSLIDNCKNVEYIEMENFDDCCGFAGEFALKNHKLSKTLSLKKAKNVINTGADYVITVCPSCILGLKQGLSEFKKTPKVLTLSDFLLKLNIL